MPRKEAASRRHTPSRIVLARKRRMLLTWELADALGMNRRRLHDLEKGRAVATEAEIAALAERLRFPAGFFYGPHIEEPTWSSI